MIMISRAVSKSIVTALVLICGGVSVTAQTQYKEYKRTVSLDSYFTIRGDKNGNLNFSAPSLSAPVAVKVDVQSPPAADSSLRLGQDVVFFGDRLEVGKAVFAYDRIIDLHVDRRGDTTVVEFLTSGDTSRSIMRARQGNVISAFAPIQVRPNQFVRGNVFSVTGDIDVAGEVNKDVVSLFGRVTTGATAVVRGAVVALTGDLKVQKETTVYGSVLSRRARKLYRYQLWSRDREFRIDPDVRYNRVDGLELSMGMSFQDHDSTLPSFWIKGGYAFESARWRYRFGVEQTITKSPVFVVGGEAYRRLASSDDWLLSDYENLAYVVTAREDFKDYYEAEGGVLYTRFRPVQKLTLGIEYRNEQTNWLNAHPRLWAIFGGHKTFRENFSTVDTAYRRHGMAEIDTTRTAGLIFSATYDTRSADSTLDRSGWAIAGALEWSSPDFSSDFDYRRYTLGVTRYQKIHRESMLLLRAMYGGSDGYLPMQKRFFMGGLGTWQGYGHKEYMGTRFWMTNVEYRLMIPGSEFALAAFWDCGQIANDAPINSDVDVKHTIGIAGYIASDFRLSIGKRLDRSNDADPKIYVRLTRPF
jgi:hypothetical protein